MQQGCRERGPDVSTTFRAAFARVLPPLAWNVTARFPVPAIYHLQKFKTCTAGMLLPMPSCTTLMQRCAASGLGKQQSTRGSAQLYFQQQQARARREYLAHRMSNGEVQSLLGIDVTISETMQKGGTCDILLISSSHPSVSLQRFHRNCGYMPYRRCIYGSHCR